MDGGKRCLAERRAGGAHDKTIINQIMLRFRPIAPKPANNGPVSSDLSPANKEIATNKRVKRKYVRNNNNSKCMKNKVATTLQLLPEITVKKDSPAIGISNGVDFPGLKSVQQLPSTWMSSDRMDVVSVVESWVTVECVTGTCVEEEDEGRWLGCTDGERVRYLEADTCPGFVSDGDDTVRWVNPAYRRMVVGPEEGPYVAVWLVVKERFPAECGAFSCRVRVVYCRCGGKEKEKEKEKQYYSQIVPCDVWRMKKLGGGFLWRLDVEAALSLGPLKTETRPRLQDNDRDLGGCLQTWFQNERMQKY